MVSLSDPEWSQGRRGSKFQSDGARGTSRFALKTRACLCVVELKGGGAGSGLWDGGLQGVQVACFKFVKL